MATLALLGGPTFSIWALQDVTPYSSQRQKIDWGKFPQREVIFCHLSTGEVEAGIWLGDSIGPSPLPSGESF